MDGEPYFPPPGSFDNEPRVGINQPVNDATPSARLVFGGLSQIVFNRSAGPPAGQGNTIDCGFTAHGLNGAHLLFEHVANS